MQLPKFGSVTETVGYEDGSSTVKTAHYRDYKAISTKITYTVQTKVHDSQGEMKEYLRFREEHPDELDTSFDIKRTKDGDENGYYYVIKNWTVKL